MKQSVVIRLASVTAAGALAQGTAPAPLALQTDYPKAVHYRYANNFKVKPGAEDTAYRDWLANYGGIMGVELDGRVTDAADGRREIIRRVKREHPEQLLVFYSTGHIKIPTEKSDPASGELAEYGHGHWVYLPRARVIGDVPDESGETWLNVGRSSAPVARAGDADVQDQDVAGAAARSHFNFALSAARGDDICIYALGADGQPDWASAEQVALAGTDEKAGRIRVRRGCYGTHPRAFRGQVFAAVHAEVVKFHGWLYNFSTFCPRDRNGRTAGDVWAAAYARNFQPGGRAEWFDALQHDTLSENLYAARGLDLNNNGVDDAGEELGGINGFGVGLCQALEKLRAAMPPGKLLIPDACNRAFFVVNGWEVEGFPGRLDPGWRQYSSLCNDLEFSRHFCRTPRFTQVQHKIFNYTLGAAGQPYVLEGASLPFHFSRAVLGLATVYEAAVTWYSQPPKEPDGRPGVYDEIRMGQAGRLGWLGKPLGEPVYPGRSEKDLCAGAVAKPGRIVAEKGTSLEYRADGLYLSQPKRDQNARIYLSLISDAPDLFVCMRLRGAPRQGARPRMPRAVRVSVSGDAYPESYLIPREGDVDAGLLLRDGSTVPLRSFGGTRMEYAFGLHAVRIWARDPEAVAAFWQAKRKVPSDGRLTFWTAQGRFPCSVEMAEVKADGAAGLFRSVVAPFTHVSPAGSEQSLDLAPHGLAGKRVCVRFLCAAVDGKAEAVWAEPSLGSPDLGGNLPSGPIRAESRGWFCEQPVTQFFHFHHIPSGVPLALAVEVEGGEEASIEALSAHAAPAAVAREFEHGLVLANPSPRPYRFELGKLFPGGRFRRLLGTPTQERLVNNGQPVGASAELGKWDGLFLSREPAAGEIR